MVRLCRSCLFFSSLTSRPRYCRTWSRNQEPLKRKILQKQLFGISTEKTLGAGFLQAASPKGTGLNWISSLSFAARVQKYLFLNTHSHPSKNILFGIRFAGPMSFQDFYQKPVEFQQDSAGKSSASPFSYCSETLFGTRKIKAINRVFLMERGDIQTFCSSTACFTLSLLLML